MKKHVIVLLCTWGLLLFPTALSAQMTEADKLWDQAVAAEQAGNKSKALNLYRKCQRATKEKSFKADCERRIKVLDVKKDDPFLVVPDTVRIPATGEFKKVTIRSNPKNWNYRVISGHLREIRKDGNQLLIVSQVENSSLERVLSVVQITAGQKSATMYVVQEASSEILRSSSEELNPPAKGEQYVLDINANYTAWTCTEGGEWYQARRDSDKLIIEISPNDLSKERSGNIIIKGKNKKLTIKIIQHADDERISFSQNSLYFPVESESRMVGVHTNADTWYVGNAPDWCSVEKVGNDSIRITTYRNTSDNIPREASIRVNTELQSHSLNIYQDARPYVPEYVFKKVLEGKNISFGAQASYLFPMVSTSSSGSYTGSVINYSLGNEKENVNFSSAVGFNAGVIADFRIYRNLYLITQLNYTYAKYTNAFSNEMTRYILPLTTTVSVGKFQNSFKEDYSFHTIEMPILASYRFVLTRRSNLQVNLGPVLSYGISAKMKLTGNSNSEEVYTHLINNNQIGQVIGNKFAYHTRINGEMNLYDNLMKYTTTYSTGMGTDIQSEYTAKSAPMSRLNFGVQLGLTYELAGFQVGVSYTHMLTNMANSKFWDSDRIPILGQTSDVLMSGYKQHMHFLQIKVGYVFRY